MDTRHLRHFLNLAETLHFGRASEASHVSPSTLSRLIRQLEEQLGVTLFERDNRSVRLTRQGQVFQQYAKEALTRWEHCRHLMMEESEQLHGELSLYSSVTASYSFLYALLSELRQKHPGIGIKLHTGDPAHAIRRVMNENDDLTIAARPDVIPDGLAFTSLGHSPLVFIAPNEMPDGRAAFKPPRRHEEWADVPMILSETGLSRTRTEDWFRQWGIKPTVKAQAAGNEAIVAMVGLGMGIGVVPRIVVDNSPLADRVQVLNVQPELTAYDVGLCVLRKRLDNPLIRALWSLVGQHRHSQQSTGI